MNFTEYQIQSSASAIYPGQGTTLGLAYVGLGLGEAGEVQGKIKKILRDDNGVITDEKRLAIAGELGDVLWYIAQTCNELDIRMHDVARLNLTKLADRRHRGVLGGSGDNR